MESLQIALSAALLLLSAALLLAGRKRRTSRSPPEPFPIPIIGHLHLLGPALHQSFHRLSQKYGELMQVRLGSVRCVVVSSPGMAKECLKTNELAFSSRHNSTAIEIVTYNNSSFAFAPYGPYWKYVKKLCTYELLGARNLLHFQPIRTLEVTAFLQTLVKKGYLIFLTL